MTTEEQQAAAKAADAAKSKAAEKDALDKANKAAEANNPDNKAVPKDAVAENTTTKATNPVSHSNQSDTTGVAEGEQERYRTADEMTDESKTTVPASESPAVVSTAKHDAGTEAQRLQAKQAFETGFDVDKHLVHDKLRALIAAYPDDTPAEHVLFGYAGVRVTFGDMKAMFG